MLSIFGPEPPPSLRPVVPIARAKRRASKPSAEVVDLAARQTAKTALSAATELSERLAAYGLYVELVAAATARVSENVERHGSRLGDLAETVNRDRNAAIMRHDSIKFEVDELRRYSLRQAKEDYMAKLVIAASLVVLALCTIGNVALWAFGR
jgi:hypothetical protein